jgi:hypothetical protein
VEPQHPCGLAADGDVEVTATAGQVRAQNCRPITTLGLIKMHYADRRRRIRTLVR